MIRLDLGQHTQSRTCSECGEAILSGRHHLTVVSSYQVHSLTFYSESISICTKCLCRGVIAMNKKNSLINKEGT